MDAAILRVSQLNNNKGVIKDMGKLPESFPWGVQVDAIRPEEAEPLRKAGCDYLVFGIEGVPATVLNEENIGKVLSIGLSLDDALMRVLEDMPTDAIIIESYPEEKLTVKGLMAYRSVVAYVSKPVLSLAPLDIDEGDLMALQNVGIIGVVVEPRSAGDMRQVSKLRKAIESLPPREVGEKGGWRR